MWMILILAVLLLTGCQSPESASSPATSPSLAANPGSARTTELETPGPDRTPDAAATEECCHESMNSEDIDPMSVFNLQSTWRTQDNQQFRLSELKGQVTCMALVYSSCQSACPRIVEDVRLIRQGLPGAAAGRVRYVLVSLDPAVDTPSRLKVWARERKLDSDWTLLTGSPDDVLELSAVLGVKYRKVSKTDYAHSNLISILNQEGVVVHRQEGLAQSPAPTIEAIRALLGSNS